MYLYLLITLEPRWYYNLNKHVIKIEELTEIIEISSP